MLRCRNGGGEYCVDARLELSLLCQIDMTLPKIFREVSGVTVRLMSDKELALARLDRDRPDLMARVRAI
jgi:hypothetical protein